MSNIVTFILDYTWPRELNHAPAAISPADTRSGYKINLYGHSSYNSSLYL